MSKIAFSLHGGYMDKMELFSVINQYIFFAGGMEANFPSRRKQI